MLTSWGCRDECEEGASRLHAEMARSQAEATGSSDISAQEPEAPSEVGRCTALFLQAELAGTIL